MGHLSAWRAAFYQELVADSGLEEFYMEVGGLMH